MCHLLGHANAISLSLAYCLPGRLKSLERKKKQKRQKQNLQNRRFDSATTYFKWRRPRMPPEYVHSCVRAFVCARVLRACVHMGETISSLDRSVESCIINSCTRIQETPRHPDQCVRAAAALTPWDRPLHWHGHDARCKLPSHRVSAPGQSTSIAEIDGYGQQNCSLAYSSVSYVHTACRTGPPAPECSCSTCTGLGARGTRD